MKSVTTAVAVIVVLIVGIALLNWKLVTQPVPVNLFIRTVDVPLALLLLVAFAVVALLHFASIGRIRIAAAFESRDLHRELDRARRTANSAEESRVAGLQTYLDQEIPQIELKLDQVLDRLGVRPATNERANLRQSPGVPTIF